MKILLIRHGDWERGDIDSSLNEEGRNQVQKLMEDILKVKIDIIYSSPMRRAKETSEIIRSKIKKPVFYIDALKDVNLAKVNFEDIKTALSQRKSLSRLWVEGKLKNAESIFDFQTRVEQGFKEICKQHKDSLKTILIITHLECIWAILALTESINFFIATRKEIPYAFPILINFNN